MEKNLTTGSVFKNVIFFSLPYLLSYFLQTLYGMADLFIIGQFEGVASTTAVSIGSQVMHILTVMIVGLAWMLVFHPLTWNVLLAGIPDLAQAMQVPAATWMSVMSQSSTNSAIVIWCIAAASYEQRHSLRRTELPK